MPAPPLPAEPYVPAAVIAELLNISESWILRYGDEHGLPVHRVGTQRRYKITQVTAWVEAGGHR